MNNVSNINTYIANLAILNGQIHNLHFNVTGTNFPAVHKFLEGVYDELFEYYDAAAELLKIQGLYPQVKYSDYLAAATVKEYDSRDFTTREAYQILQEDLVILRDLALAIRKEADAEGDFEWVNLLEDHLAYYQKQLWFVRASLAGCAHSK